MLVELINTGSELMLGRTLNTHQQWLCHKLADIGFVVTRQVAIADDADAIEQAVRESLGRAQLIIVTGGLGPTSDDITRERIAALLGKPLHTDASIVAGLEKFFASRNRPMPARNLVQAQVPESALVLANPNGTAPGLAMEVGGGWLIMLPGPPRELRPMFLDSVVPLLRREFPPQIFACRTLRTAGIGESALAELIEAPLQTLVADGLELGYCARPGQVDVRLAARTPDAAKLVEQAGQIVGKILAEQIFAHDDEDIATVIVRELTTRKQTLAIAESCTGGAISNAITNVPGASAILLAGLVTYANTAKTKFVGVRPETLAAHGAVSEPVVREMAEGARREAGADFGIAVTGIAGPGGGSDEKPVGTVFMAVSSASGTTALKQINRYDRETFKDVTTQQVLEMLRRVVVC